MLYVYDSLDACCAAEFGWITRGLCVSRSNATTTVGQEEVCQKDTAAKDISAQLYGTAEENVVRLVFHGRGQLHIYIATSKGVFFECFKEYFVDQKPSWASTRGFNHKPYEYIYCNPLSI